MMPRPVTGSRICRWTSVTCHASYIAIEVTNLLALPMSLPSLKKKKLAVSCLCSKYSRATVCAIVNYLVPAMPPSQKRYCVPSPLAQRDTFYRTSTRVLRRQVSSCWRSYKLKGVFVAEGRGLKGSSRPIACQFLVR
jgi:hypothetical protein